MAQDLQALRQRYGPRYPVWLTALLMTGSMAMILASTSINVALPAIMDDFSIGRPLAQWLSTGFLASMTAGLLLAAGSQARLGTRSSAQLALGIFILASILALVAEQAWQLIALRIVQGFCAGLLQPLSMVLIFRLFDGPGRGMALGIYGMGVMVAPTLGPSIGGYLIDHFDWHSVFWMPLPMCVVALLGGIWLLPGERQRGAARVDLLAFVLLCVALFALLGALAEAQRFGWGNPRAWVPALLGSVATLAFYLRSRRQAQPLLPLQLWRNPSFRSASWVALVLGMGLYGSTYLLPLFLQTVEGYSAGLAGVMLLPTGFVLGIASFIGGWATDRFSAVVLLVGGLLIFALSMAGLGWVEQGSSFLVLCLWACLGRFGLGLLLPALSTGSMDVLSPEELSQGAGAITFVRQLGGAFGINLLTYFLEWRHLAEGTGTAANAEAFRQTFWLVALLFLLAAVPALGVRRRQFPDPHP
ncbi:DHA2 family efflux MFS transporter permease subunit [Pseudomonas mangrovi]|uniref:MFS transporter n=1 Tax=Pseudomonas mangrovi TaxID=2161748 RepID=A0A2T5PAP6_9PSED|nr:DHA2 family efflux MFS transporter permease subunit [Pseudomonas mangrovi]PTU74810.1 MFS transporter [Pseudomonas mangrovi]